MAFSLLLTINPSAKASDIWKFGMELLDCIRKLGHLQIFEAP